MFPQSDLAAGSGVASLFRSQAPEETAAFEGPIRAEIARAFDEKRAFCLFPDRSLTEQLRLGGSSDMLTEHLRRIKDELLERSAAGIDSDAQLLKNDARLSARLLHAVRLLHTAIAETETPSVVERRFVLIRESRGSIGLPCGNGQVVLARVGKGPHGRELPTIYLPLRLFDLLANDESQGAAELFAGLVRLLAVEERAIQTGYAHVERPSPNDRRLFGVLTDALRASVRPLESVLAPGARSARARPFRAADRERLLELLDARRVDAPETFDPRRVLQAVAELNRLSRLYKGKGDRDSLREVVRLLVAASGHDLHEVRDRANVLLERIFAPKPFDAPLATSFRTVRCGSAAHFVFDLTRGRHTYLLRLYHGSPQSGLSTEDDIEWEDVPLRFEPESGRYTADHVFLEAGPYDYAVLWRARRTLHWVAQRRCSGRVSVIPDVAGQIVLEIFPDIHGHTRTYWRSGDGHPGLVYNESGQVIRLGRFSDITAHLADIQRRYRITAIYLLGIQRRGANRHDWAHEATSPSPFAPMSLVEVEGQLGGEKEFRALVAAAHELGIRVIVDIIPHLNRGSREVPEGWRVGCYDAAGSLVTRSSTDGRYGEWNDGVLLNYRKFEVWEWIAASTVKLIEEYDVDGIRFDSAHAVPIMMKRNNYRYCNGGERSAEETVEGTIVTNDREEDHFVTTGFYDCASREEIANPFQTYLVASIDRVLHERGKQFFVYLAECYWGRERYLARSGIIPYNSALFKICEDIVSGKCDVREIYRLYDDYFPRALPPGTELLGIVGNHDEERALAAFGAHALKAVLALTTFMSGMILDYEGNAEGQTWKVYVDNIYVDWNRFDYAAQRGLELLYGSLYAFHRANPGRGRLLWANNPMVAAALKAGDRALVLGMFNFSNDNQAVSIQFDNPTLPIDDGCYYRLVDPLYSSVTHGYDYYTGRELRDARVHSVVPYTDRLKFLRLELVAEPEALYGEFLRGSLVRLCTLSDPHHFASSFAFLEIAAHSDGIERFVSFVRDTLVPLFEDGNRQFLELGLKRALFYLQRRRYRSDGELLRFIARLCSDAEPGIRNLGEWLRLQNTRRPIVFISAEAEPFSKFGGLGTVVYELPRELVRLGEEVYVITPLYRFGEEKTAAGIRRATEKYGIHYTGRNVVFKIREVEYEVGLHAGDVDGVHYLLLDHYELFDGLYWGYTAEEKLRRRIGFARACAEVIACLDLQPSVTLTNDAFAGLFNGIVRLDPYYANGRSFGRTSFIHLIHNGGWQYFDAYYRYEQGVDLFTLFNLPAWKAGDFCDPVHGEKLNCMAAGIRCADRVITVSPAYAKQLATASDGLERLLHEVAGINNAVGRDFRSRLRRRFDRSGFVEHWYPRLLDHLREDRELYERLRRRYPEILAGPHACEHTESTERREIQVRLRNKLLLQLREGMEVDPDRVLFCMIHRIVEQKGFDLLLAASEGVFSELCFQGIIAGPVSSGDRRAGELADGLSRLSGFYPRAVSVHLGFYDIAIPLLASDVFLMPSLYEPGGIAQLEAMAAGCLVVARATGGLRDTVFPIRTAATRVSGNGFLFTDYTPQAFLDAMRRCAAFFHRSRERLVSNARHNARKSVRYWDASAARYLEEIYALKETVRPEPLGTTERSPRNASRRRMGQEPRSGPGDRSRAAMGRCRAQNAT